MHGSVISPWVTVYSFLHGAHLSFEGDGKKLLQVVMRGTKNNKTLLGLSDMGIGGGELKDPLGSNGDQRPLRSQ